MEKIRFEWSQLTRTGRIAVGPLVLFIAIAIPLLPPATTLASAGSTISRGDQQPRIADSLTLIAPGFALQNPADGTNEVSNQLATYLQVVLVVIVCLLLLSATVYFSMSWTRRATPTRPPPRAPTPVAVDPILIPQEPDLGQINGDNPNNSASDAGGQTPDEQIHDTDELPSRVSTTTLDPPTEGPKIVENGAGKVAPRLPDRRIHIQIDGAAREEMRVYCTVHRVGFRVSRSGRDIRCNHDHLLASNFPYGADWVFCCDCQRFSLAGDAEEAGSKACPCCERRMVRMYLCDQCHVLSAESRTLVLIKYMIKDEGIWPSCPGCLAGPPVELWTHQCAVVEAELMSVVQPCHWCEQAPPFE